MDVHEGRRLGVRPRSRGGRVACVYGEPIEVLVAGGRPAGFVWRGHRHRVRRVLEHWVVTRQWWAERHAGDPFWEDPGEREFWKVEAACGEQGGLYELCHEPADESWTLLRAW